MHIAMKLLVAFVALGLMFLGVIFIIAGTTENLVYGAVMLAISFGLLGFIFAAERIEARRPITQEYHVTMGGSGEFRDRRIDCPSCGAPVEAEHVELMSGGLVIKCPYCNTVSAMEEEPKW